MCLNINFLGQLSVTKNLDQLLGRHITGLHQDIQGYLVQVFRFSQLLNRTQIHRHILDAVNVLEAKLRKATLQRHLTTLETNLLFITGTLLRTLVTAR